ncbi:MAG: hydrogenase formation protein HypD [Lachnospiraceae bacterium]|nr:hydrogenase formation protein HypD [Lachnospiraceae bacterium]
MADTIGKIVDALKSYDGEPIRLMEVCGTHTAEIARNGIPSLLSPKIRLISGPGCPVCVTVTAYIDRLIALSEEEDTTVLTFGDLMRVPGSAGSLADAKSRGASVDYVYAPSEILTRAEEHPDRRFIFAAVGFETTAPVYAALIREIAEKKLDNIGFLTSLKTMPQAIRYVCTHAREPIDGFLAPGHVCAVTGTGEYAELASELGRPFVVSGFRGEELLTAIYALVRLRGRGEMRNLYPAVVREEGNERAISAMREVFAPADAAWRGMGVISASGLLLSEAWRRYDAGSEDLTRDHAPAGCRCGDVLTGSIDPAACPLFGNACTPEKPHGACMVSAEGSCHSRFVLSAH